MSVTNKFLAASVAAAALTWGTAQAAPVFGAGNTFNGMEMVALENQYRAEGLCGTNCLAASAQDPAGYRRVNPFIADNTAVGDIFIGVIAIGKIFNNVEGTTWNADDVPAGGIDNFTGYFAQEVVSKAAESATVDHITLGALSVPDPFGKLLAGEMFRLWVDDGAAPPATPFERNGTILDDITKATDGTFFGSFGLGVGLCDEPTCTAGFAYTHIDDSLTGANIEGNGFLALNSLVHGPAWTLGNLAPINAFGENEVGGFDLPPVTGNCIGAIIGATCTEFFADFELVVNDDGPIAGGNSPWLFENNDPIRFYVVPEPTSLALIGLGMLGAGVASRRKQKKA